MKNKKAMDMSWTMIGWMILALVALIVIIIIIQKGTAPGFDILGKLGGP